MMWNNKNLYKVLVAFVFQFSMLHSQNSFINNIEGFIQPIKKFILQNNELEEFKNTYNQTVEIKLTIEPTVFNYREWTPYLGGKEISMVQFWQLMGDFEKAKYFKKIEKDKKNMWLRPIIFAFASAGLVISNHYWVKKVENGSGRDGFGSYQTERVTWKRKNLLLLSVPSLSVMLYELWMYPKAFYNIPIKNLISYYDIKPIVEEYNSSLPKFSADN